VSYAADAETDFNDEDPWLCNFAGIEVPYPSLSLSPSRVGERTGIPLHGHAHATVSD